MAAGRAARALAALGAVAALAAVAAGTAGAAPLEWRGVVEGAYGAPWDHAERSRVLAWMPAHGFNAYVHAPKDDLYQRTRWRDPYPTGQQAQFDAEIAFARAHGIEWIPNLSPALPLIPTVAAPDAPPSRDLCFSCATDLDAVVAKLEPFRQAGTTTFMISFDDVTKTFSHPEDVAAYGVGDEAFGRANGDFLTRLLRALRARSPGARLLTVGADYSGTADTAYLRGLRATLDPAVGVMWTGPDIPSKPFSPADAGAYGRWIGRRPLVWDNWTDDDTAGNATPAGTARIFLGPYVRRADAATAVAGFFLNPMNEADLNLLPLATAGDWMRDPVRYSPRRSWLRAVKAAAGARGRRSGVRASLRAFAETSYSTKLDFTEAPTFVRLSRRFLGSYAGPFWGSARSSLSRELGLVVGAPRALGGLGPFFDQAKPFLDAASQSAGVGRTGTDLLAAERPLLDLRRSRSGRFVGTVAPPDPKRADGLRSRFKSGATTMRTSRRFTYGWRGGTAFDIPPYPVPGNVMDDYTDAVDALDSAWQGHADQASRSVVLTLAGRRVQVEPAGRFRLPRTACGKALVARDGAGGLSGRVLPRCRG